LIVYIIHNDTHVRDSTNEKTPFHNVLFMSKYYTAGRGAGTCQEQPVHSSVASN